MPNMIPGESLLRQLRVLGEDAASGRLDVLQPPFSATLQLQGGVITHIDFGGRSDVDALFEALALDSPQLFWASNADPVQPTMHLTIDELASLWRDRQAPSLPAAEGASPGVAIPALDKYDIALIAVDSLWRPSRYELVRPLKPSYTLGCSAHCDIRINHPSVRQVHCGLMVEDDFIRIWDLGSHNATHVNGELTDQAILKSGDVIRVGEIELRLVFRLRRPDLLDRPAAPPIDPPEATDLDDAPLRYETIRKSRDRGNILSRIFRPRSHGGPGD